MTPTPELPAARIAVRDLHVAFGDRTVVELEALVLRPGEIVGIAGESGSGKSMTAMAIMGLAPALGARVRGSVLLDGRELIGLPERALREIRGRRIAVIFQNPVSAMNPVFRVGDLFVRTLVLHGAPSKREARASAEAALGEVLLGHDLLRRYPHQLSGGQAQRVAIAMALALRSEVLIADEATSALDVTVQASILELIRRLRDERGVSVLFISHDLAVIAELCDRITVMRAGRVIEQGTASAVLGDPREDYTRELVAAVPKVGAR
jgi:ABC-type glutathione transport system ATPase component